MELQPSKLDDGTLTSIVGTVSAAGAGIMSSLGFGAKAPVASQQAEAELFSEGDNYTPEQEAHLLRCFTLCDESGDGKMMPYQFMRMTRCMGIDDQDTETSLNKYPASYNGITYGLFRQIFMDLERSFRYMDDRCYILLSLEEAEHMRGILHSRDTTYDTLIPEEGYDNTPDARVTTCALWLMGDHDATLLAHSKGWKKKPVNGPHQSMVSCFRYINSDIYFNANSLILLLRVLEVNTCENREKWWTDIRACRRRRQVSWDISVPISTVFQTVTEIEYVEYAVTISRIQSELQEKGMLLYDAFRAMNSSASGLLSCSELFGGLDFLDIPFEKEEVYALVRKLSVQNDGTVSYVDFKRTFATSDSELESRNAGDEGTFFETIPPHKIPELHETNDEAGANGVKLTEEILNNFKAKSKSISEFLPVWNSQNTSSRMQVSIWAPSLSVGWGGVAKTRIMLCHYASPGFRNPLKLKGSEKYETIVLTDVATIRMKRAQTLAAVLKNLFPNPLRYREAWHMKRGARSLYCWKGIAPDNFACLGQVFTCTDAPPKLTDIRCVPAKWVIPSQMQPQKIWDDTGSGGGKPGSLWLINDMNMVVMVNGHEAPGKEECQQLSEKKFYFEGFNFNTLTH
jgi:Ca2+-binding EF-hand superfamily protein